MCEVMCSLILLSSQPDLSSLHLFVSSVTMAKKDMNDIQVCLAKGAVVKTEPGAVPAQPPPPEVAQAGPSDAEPKALMMMMMVTMMMMMVRSVISKL